MPKIGKSTDKRPAIAFDNKNEIQAIIDALKAYRYDHIDTRDKETIEFYKRLTDVAENCMKLFDKKPKGIQNDIEC
tara:strand:+ start:352 stop:579 length:228 start_codon:yes stop_codon:yes gene_type:complete